MPRQPDELLHQDSAGDRLYAAPPRGQHGTLLFIRPGDGELHVPTAAVDAFRAALAGDVPLDEAAIRADERAKTLRDGAEALRRIDPVEWALAGQHAGADAAKLLLRMADGTAT